MATRPSKTIIQGCQVLTLMAATPTTHRTVAGLAEASGGELTPAQVESALLAFVEAGWVQQVRADSGATFYLLGASHLRLALAELDGLLGGLATLQTLMGAGDQLATLRRLLMGLRGPA